MSITSVGLKLGRVLTSVDTNTIRVLIAVGSLVYSAFLWYNLDRFALPYWEPMRVFSENTWAWLYLTHALGVFWRQIDDVPRPFIAFAISAWGILLWFVQTGMLTQHNGISPSNALEFTVIAFGTVALIRTGLNDDKVSP